MHRGRNVLRLPIEERRKLLTEALRKVEYPVIQSMPFNVKPAELIRAAKQLELEGVIAKRNGSLYEPCRRSGAWVTYKLNFAQEFVIAGYTFGNPFDALIVGCHEGGNLAYVGKVRNGFVPHIRRELMAKMKPLKTDACPFANLPEKRHTQWALTREQNERLRLAQTGVGRSDRVYRVDAGWTPATLRLPACDKIRLRMKSCASRDSLFLLNVCVQ